MFLQRTSSAIRAAFSTRSDKIQSLCSTHAALCASSSAGSDKIQSLCSTHAALCASCSADGVIIQSLSSTHAALCASCSAGSGKMQSFSSAWSAPCTANSACVKIMQRTFSATYFLYRCQHCIQRYNSALAARAEIALHPALLAAQRWLSLRDMCSWISGKSHFYLYFW